MDPENKNEEVDFDDTEFVVGSDKTGVPPAMKNQFKQEDDSQVEVSTEPEQQKTEEKPKESEDDFELEIVDDTPPEDRNRKPLPDEVVEEIEQDAAEDYSAKVKQRIDQLKKAWHDERRAKEQAAREREAAAEYAQRLQAEREKLQRELSSGESWALEQAKQRAALQLDAAKRKYRDAYEQGDSEALTDAQQELAKATYQAERAELLSPRYSQQNLAQQQNSALQQNAGLQQPNQQVYNSQQEPQVSASEPDQKAKEWGERNKWFGSDDEMTSFALGVHQKLVKDGVPPSTDEYYERIDARMREVFPDRFEDAQPSAEKEPPKRKKRQPSTVVAPAGRTPKGKKVVLTQSQVAMAKKLGISPEAYAREVQKLEANNG
jgi:hypothetical protein